MNYCRVRAQHDGRTIGDLSITDAARQRASGFDPLRPHDPVFQFSAFRTLPITPRPGAPRSLRLHRLPFCR